MAGTKKTRKKTTTRKDAVRKAVASVSPVKRLQEELNRAHQAGFAAGGIQARADVMTFLTELNDPLLNVVIAKLRTQWETEAATVIDNGEIRFGVYADVSGSYRWRAMASNGEIMADSGESFASKSNANRSMLRFIELVKKS